MGRLVTYTFMICGLIVLLWLGGVYDPSSSTSLLSLLLNPSNAASTTFWLSLKGGIAQTSLIIVVGYLTKDIDKTAATAMITTISIMLWEVTSVISLTASTHWIGAILQWLIFAPLMFVLMITFVEWWRLKD